MNSWPAFLLDRLDEFSGEAVLGEGRLGFGGDDSRDLPMARGRVLPGRRLGQFAVGHRGRVGRRYAFDACRADCQDPLVESWAGPVRPRPPRCARECRSPGRRIRAASGASPAPQESIITMIARLMTTSIPHVGVSRPVRRGSVRSTVPPWPTTLHHGRSSSVSRRMRPTPRARPG